jgi:hypothetical protein
MGRIVSSGPVGGGLPQGSGEEEQFALFTRVVYQYPDLVPAASVPKEAMKGRGVYKA